jgi:hypothetical protein
MKRRLNARWLALPAVLAAGAAHAGRAPAEPTTTPGPTAATIFRNADLEEGGAGPAGWYYSHSQQSTGSWSWDTSHAHSGQRGFRLHKENAQGYSALQSDYLPVEPGKPYEVTAWVKLHQPTKAGVYLVVNQYRADNKELQLPCDFGEVRRQYPAGEWQRLRLAFTARESNTRIRVLGIVAGEAADVTWDDFALEIKER